MFIGRSGVAEAPFDRLMNDMRRVVEAIVREAARRRAARG
jgi:hypothetical protein